MSNLPPGVSANDIPDALDPRDYGIGLHEWAQNDLMGFSAAVLAAAEGEEEDILWAVVLGEKPPTRIIDRRMDERLQSELDRPAPWVVQYMAKYGE